MKFKELNSVTNDVAAISASEWHGLLIGYLSLSPNVKLEQMPEYLLDVFKALPEAATLVEEFAAALADIDGSITMILPPDADALKARLQALKDWVRGFLTGLGLAGFTEYSFKDDDIKEVIADLSEISELDVNSSDSDEAGEEFYTEIYEYVKSVSLLLALAYHSQARGSGDTDKKLH